MEKKPQMIAIGLGAMILIGFASFYSGKLLYYKDGYRDGVIFADSSSYKRGKAEGYKEGYEYCDSLSKDLNRLRTSEMFNLNIIFEELADPKNYIKVTGTIEKNESARHSKYVKAKIVNSASFARYNELVLTARFKDKRGGIISEIKVELPDVLYPRKTLSFEIPEKDVPDLSESLELVVESAEGMD